MRHLVFLSIIAASLSACTIDEKAYTIPLEGAQTVLSRGQMNPNIRIHLSQKLPGPDALGGEDGRRQVKFQNIIPWFSSHISDLNNPGCNLKNKIRVDLKIEKFYSGVESQVMVGTLVLKAQYHVRGKLVSTQSYRSECEMGFFSILETPGMQTCMNKAFKKIVPNIKQDICRFAS